MVIPSFALELVCVCDCCNKSLFPKTQNDVVISNPVAWWCDCSLIMSIIYNNTRVCIWWGWWWWGTIGSPPCAEQSRHHPCQWSHIIVCIHVKRKIKKKKGDGGDHGNNGVCGDCYVTSDNHHPPPPISHYVASLALAVQPWKKMSLWPLQHVPLGQI